MCCFSVDPAKLSLVSNVDTLTPAGLVVCCVVLLVLAPSLDSQHITEKEIKILHCSSSAMVKYAEF